MILFCNDLHYPSIYYWINLNLNENNPIFSIIDIYEWLIVTDENAHKQIQKSKICFSFLSILTCAIISFIIFVWLDPINFFFAYIFIGIVLCLVFLITFCLFFLFCLLVEIFYFDPFSDKEGSTTFNRIVDFNPSILPYKVFVSLLDFLVLILVIKIAVLLLFLVHIDFWPILRELIFEWHVIFLHFVIIILVLFIYVFILTDYPSMCYLIICTFDII